jgi:hypothetical protein
MAFQKNWPRILDCGSVAFRLRSRLYLGGASIHGLSSRGSVATLTLRRNDGRGTRTWVRPESGVRRGGGSSLGDVKGARHAGNAYAG